MVQQETLPAPVGPDKNKALSRSVSMPIWLWDLIEAHAATTAAGDRSGYLKDLAQSDLRRLGKLPGTQANSLVVEFAEMLSDPDGIALAKDILIKMAQAKAAKEGGRTS